MAHKWDYEHPLNLWESWPWFVRWTVAVALVIYFGGGIIAFMVGMSRLSP